MFEHVGVVGFPDRLLPAADGLGNHGSPPSAKVPPLILSNTVHTIPPLEKHFSVEYTGTEDYIFEIDSRALLF